MANGGLCILGDITFRINPNDISWNFQVHTSVTPTVGGRVVQVLGASLSDITITGMYGENRLAHVLGHDSSEKSPGRSWRMAEAFASEVHRLMQQQSPPPGTSKGYQQPVPLRWFYPPRGWDFLVYIKSLQDLNGGVVSHKYGKFSYGYTLTLFPVKDNTFGLTGDTTTLKTAQNKALETAIARISNGLGWQETKYNDPGLQNQIGSGDVNSGVAPTDNSGSRPPGGPANARF